MNFLLIYLIILIMIISNNFFLFNEEFLILIAFTSFCFIIYNKLTPLISLRLENKSFFIEKSFVTSLNLIHNILIDKKKNNLKFNNLKFIFISLKKYYSNFSIKFINEFLKYLKFIEKNNLIIKLNYFTVLEKNYKKFITSLLIEKLNKINNSFNFFNSKIKIKKFQTINAVNRLNLIKKI
uniref:ATP synthase F0 subunit b n=1 Tax=Vertebrata lanosa TaxID=1261582 RepID=A0A1J0F7G9_9FLOR|nr:ATP synthase F0 subunit b [Vertebrata lanosa]APC24946.1 ATP synthase F0 subunit b [Vertebrata lanosa]